MDIFDFFKENEQQLYERPSDKVWMRLEQQLRQRRHLQRRRREIQFLQLGIAALTLLLLLLAAVLVWHFARLQH